jgi:RNA polymerase sigma-70 factor (ECF subfamily)
VYPRLRAYIVRRAGIAVADDLLSETMARAIAGIERFTWQPAGFDGWLFGIARRVCADHFRHHARRSRPVDSPEGTMAADVDEGLVRADEWAEMRMAFAKLPVRQRELLELRVIAGFSVEETAAVLGKRPGAVRTAQSRALARLRHLMGEQR